MSDPELKPCPFCGGQPELRDCSPDDEEWGVDIGEWWMVTCVPCGIALPIIESPTREQAIAAWNTRANFALHQRCEKLRDFCGEIIACLRVNRLRETLAAKDEAGNREFDALIEAWLKRMTEL